MKKVALALLLLFSTLALAKTNPNPVEYTVNVHVSSSRLEAYTNAQMLTVIINGKKYELRGYGPTFSILELGDYKAKLVHDEHKTTYDSYQIYEFLFPDQKTRQFTVATQME